MSLANDLKPLRNEYSLAPFWFWNDEITPEEVRRQIVTMYEQNIGGFFMHARMGRVTPYMGNDWMAAIKAGVDQARELGMDAWLYDEDGWPSGYGGGAVIDLGDDYLQKYALAEEIAVDRTARIFDADKVIAAFACNKTDDGFSDVQQLEVTGEGTVKLDNIPGNHLVVFRHELHNIRRFFSPESWADGYVDVLDPKVVRAFIRTIYERYRKVIGDDFGTVVPGIFTDEPSYHDHGWRDNVARLPISPVLEAEFLKRYGSKLSDTLMTIAYGGEDAMRARWCYHTALAHLFATSFTKQLATWCEKHNLAFTGHYLLEEYPRASAQVVGDVMQHYYYQQIPGIDHLGKPLDLPDFWSSTRVLVKQASSICHQFDKPRLMCETFAGGGWDFGPVEQKWMGDYQYVMGLNLPCPHAFHYTLRGFRKRDYPPSLGFQQPWFQVSADLGSHFSRLGYLLTRGRRVVNVLMIHPLESFFATQEVTDFPWSDDALSDSLKRTVKALCDHQIDFDFGNEVLMGKHGSVDNGQMIVGSAAYDAVVVPHSVTLRKSTLRLLTKFIAAGGKVFTIDPTPTCIEGVIDDNINDMLAKAETLGQWDDDQLAASVVEQVGPVAQSACVVEGDGARDILVMHRRTDDEDIFFLTSARREPHTCTVMLKAQGTPQLLDTTTGELSTIPAESDENGARMELTFDDARSYPIVMTREAVPTAKETCEVEHTIIEADAKLEYTLHDDNALLLDTCEFVVNGESRGHMLVIDAQKLIDHDGDEADVLMRFFVSSIIDVDRAALLMETPEQYDVSINGENVPTAADCEWVIDPAFRRVAVRPGLQKGENVIDVKCRWRQGVELEPIYVIGRFGVECQEVASTIVSLPNRLAVGSWHTQGLPFYAGSVTYSMDVEVDQIAGRWELQMSRYRAAAQVLVNGIDAGTLMWAPHCLDITRQLQFGTNRIEIRLYNSLRNAFGPHHLTIEDEVPCLGPHHFFQTEDRTDAYNFMEAGLLGPVTLRGYRKG